MVGKQQHGGFRGFFGTVIWCINVDWNHFTLTWNSMSERKQIRSCTRAMFRGLYQKRKKDDGARKPVNCHVTECEVLAQVAPITWLPHPVIAIGCSPLDHFIGPGQSLSLSYHLIWAILCMSVLPHKYDGCLYKAFQRSASIVVYSDVAMIANKLKYGTGHKYSV